MLQFQLIGYSHYGFTNDQGRYIEGFKFHIARPSQKREFVGNETAQLTVSEQLVQKCGTPKPGQIYTVVYDQNGRIADYQPVQSDQTRIKGA